MNAHPVYPSSSSGFLPPTILDLGAQQRSRPQRGPNVGGQLRPPPGTAPGTDTQIPMSTGGAHAGIAYEHGGGGAPGMEGGVYGGNGRRMWTHTGMHRPEDIHTPQWTSTSTPAASREPLWTAEASGIPDGFHGGGPRTPRKVEYRQGQAPYGAVNNPPYPLYQRPLDSPISPVEYDEERPCSKERPLINYTTDEKTHFMAGGLPTSCSTKASESLASLSAGCTNNNIAYDRSNLRMPAVANPSISDEVVYWKRNNEMKRDRIQVLEQLVEESASRINVLEDSRRHFANLCDTQKRQLSAQDLKRRHDVEPNWMQMEISSLQEQLSAACQVRDSLFQENQLLLVEKDKLTRQVVGLASRGTCVVCTDNISDTVILECGHLCICNTCATLEFENCPMCRGPVSNMMRVYVS